MKRYFLITIFNNTEYYWTGTCFGVKSDAIPVTKDEIRQIRPKYSIRLYTKPTTNPVYLLPGEKF